ncbi:MAG: hypothetical protein AAF823_14940 [Planctomycetota bacterium]
MPLNDMMEEDKKQITRDIVRTLNEDYMLVTKREWRAYRNMALLLGSVTAILVGGGVISVSWAAAKNAISSSVAVTTTERIQEYEIRAKTALQTIQDAASQSDQRYATKDELRLMIKQNGIASISSQTPNGSHMDNMHSSGLLRIPSGGSITFTRPEMD